MHGRLVATLSVLLLMIGCASPAPPTAPPAAPRATPTLWPTRAPTPSPRPTQTPEPSLTPAPPTAALSVSAEEIGRHLDALMQIATDNGGIRAAGTPGYDASTDYVVEQMQSMGFDVQRVPFDFTFFDEAAPVELTVGDQSWSGKEWLHSMLYAGSGDISGTLQAVQLTPDGQQTGQGGCAASEWSGFTRGNIAVIESGPCFRFDQVINAQNAGATALISLYPNWGSNQTRRPTLVFPDDVHIPAIVAGGVPTTAILAALAAGGTAHVNVETISRAATIDNIIAEQTGTSDKVVMLGGHLDSVLDGPGINDNGSGVATLMSLAKSVADNAPTTETIRFGFWGAEELGELGSSAYVQGRGSAIQRLSAYLNLDMVASPGAARFVYADEGAPPGSDQLTQQLLDALAAANTPGLMTDLGGASDHFMFEQAGIPSAGVFSGIEPVTLEQAQTFGGDTGVPVDACYHLACDTRDNINLDSAEILGNAVATVLAQLAAQP